MKRIASVIVALFACAAFAAPAFAADTLKKIKETGTITVGHRDASIPFSYLDDKQQPIGYSMDLCMKIVGAIKTKLKMPKLKVVLNPVTSQTRIPLIANGSIDMECGSTTNSVERQKQVAFLNTTFITGTKLLVKKSSKIKSYKDLKDKAVVVTNGTTNERAIKELDAKENLGMKFIPSKDHAESFLSVDSGRAVAFPMDDILLAGLINNSKNPGEFEIVGAFLSHDPYAIMISRDDPAFKKFGDEVIGGLMKSGEIKKIYSKWFQKPIPPKGNNLKFPMSDGLKEAIAHPNDKGA
ncbi:MAG: amino acid ABC transporter substrate-binding protein [Burkholderiales bacterium]|nr:amino acid ABC transporter substrate-binding protein [Burkholderiales bacterium]